ncbi:MAG TPA: DUF4157 domain-containing protein, partial [Terriglobales bacterium]
MQASLVSKSEEKKKTASSPPEGQFSVQPIQEETSDITGLPLFLQRGIKTKLAAGAEDDPPEPQRPVQARRKAASSYLPLLQRACACGGTCASCSGSLEEQNPAWLQRQLSAGASGGVVDAQIIPHESPGHSLPDSTRGFMESSFGADFSDVRVHTDEHAANSASTLSADAF